MKISSVLVVALFTSQVSAIQLESNNLIDTGCPGGGAIPIRVRHAHHHRAGGSKLKGVLRAIASDEDEDDEPKVSVVRVPAAGCAAAAPVAAAPACAAAPVAKEADAEEVGKKAGHEAKKAVEHALKK